MPTLLDRWLKSERQPAHLYELLGLPPLSPASDEAIQRIRDLSRELLSLQNSSDPLLVAQIPKLQNLLGQADRVFRSPEARLKYENELLDQWLNERNDLNSLPTQSAVAERLMESDRLQPDDARRIAARLRERSRQRGGVGEERHRIFGTSGEHRAAPLAPTAVYTPRVEAARLAVETSTSSRVATASAIQVAKPTGATSPVMVNQPSELVLELENATQAWTLRAGPALALGLAIVVLLVLNIAALAVRFSRTSASTSVPSLATEPESAAASPASPSEKKTVVPSVPKQSDPSTPTPPPQPPRKVPAEPTTWQVGTKVDVTGRLLEVQGRSVQDLLELHLRIECDNSPVKEIAAFSKDASVPASIVDYLAAQEDAEIRGVSPGQGDRVRVIGQVASPTDASLRIPSAAGATLVRLESIERVGDSASKVEPGKPARDSNTFRGELKDLALRGLMRLPPVGGETFHFRGKYQEVVAPENTWLVTLGGRLRGVELLVPDSLAPSLAANDEVEVTGASQGLIATRLVGNVIVVRPVLQAVSIRSTKSAAAILAEAKSTAEPEPSIPAGSPAPTIPTASTPPSAASTSPVSTPPSPPTATENKAATPGVPLKDRLAVDPLGPTKPSTILLGSTRASVQSRLGVSPLSVPFKTGEAERRADAYLGDGGKGSLQLSVFIYNSQQRVIYLEGKPLPSGSQLNAAAQVMQEILETFAGSPAALAP